MRTLPHVEAVGNESRPSLYTQTTARLHEATDQFSQYISIRNISTTVILCTLDTMRNYLCKTTFR